MTSASVTTFCPPILAASTMSPRSTRSTHQLVRSRSTGGCHMAAIARDPQVPTHWFNILHDRPQYVTSAVSKSRFAGEMKAAGHGVLLQQPLALARQSINTADRYIPIPEEVLDLYAQYRPTPLRRAVRLEERIGANARIYYKYEGANLAGSHKLNTALAQAYYYARAGVKHVVTGTGAGQWGTALAYACQIMNLDCTVFWVRSTLRQKPIRGDMMRLFGAVVHESPSDLTEVGRRALKETWGETGPRPVASGKAPAPAAKTPDHGLPSGVARTRCCST